MANYYERAKDILNARRNKAEAEATARRLELEAQLPELKALDDQLATVGLKAVKAIGMGEEAEPYIEQVRRENLDIQQKRNALLQKLELPANYLDPQYECSLCMDSGSYGGHYCTCFKTLVKQMQLSELNHMAPAKKSTFENFSLEYYKGLTEEDGTSVYDHMLQVLNYCKTWASDFSKDSPSILLYGRTGLGKTHLSLAIANTVIQAGHTVVYGTAQNLLTQLEKEHFGRLKDDTSPEETVLSAELLIIDDLGTEFSTSFTQSAIYNILNTRALRGLPTILNTNLMYDEIADKYSERVYSRIIGNFVPLEFLGRDIRQLQS